MGSFIPQCLDRIERRGARRAGYSPKKTPTAADTVTAITMACNENTIFHREPRNRKSEQDAASEYRSHRRHRS